MINKRGRCFNLDPVSPSKTLLERTSLAWKHGSMEGNFRYSFWRWLAAASAGTVPAASMGAAPRSGRCCTFPCKALHALSCRGWNMNPDVPRFHPFPSKATVKRRTANPVLDFPAGTCTCSTCSMRRTFCKWGAGNRRRPRATPGAGSTCSSRFSSPGSRPYPST